MLYIRRVKKIDVMLGIDAHTYEYIKTTKHTSKLGDIVEILRGIVDKEELNFLEFHCHIWSQIFDELAFCEGIETMVKFIKEISNITIFL